VEGKEAQNGGKNLSQKLGETLARNWWEEVAPDCDSRFGGIEATAYGYLPRHGASSPFDRYQIILLGKQRHICVNNLPREV